MTNQEQLLLEIANCQNVVACLHNTGKSLPCHKIVQSQGASDLRDFQVPEPWNGRLASAPILFVSSNPSISLTEEYPRWGWRSEQVADYFTNRFGGGKRVWVKDEKYPLQVDGSYNQPAVKYWSEIRKRATELMGRTARPGIDYALTEVVHCKSTQNIGVKDAVEPCTKRYLDRIMEAAAARVIVVVGTHAGKVFRHQLGIDPNGRLLWGPGDVARKRRFVLFAPAPNSSKPRMFSKLLTTAEIRRIRSVLVDDHAVSV